MKAFREPRSIGARDGLVWLPRSGRPSGAPFAFIWARAAGWIAGLILDVCVFDGCGDQAAYEEAAIAAVVLSWLALALVATTAVIAAVVVLIREKGSPRERPESH